MVNQTISYANEHLIIAQIKILKQQQKKKTHQKVQGILSSKISFKNQGKHDKLIKGILTERALLKFSKLEFFCIFL